MALCQSLETMEIFLIFSILHNQHDPRPFACLKAIVKGLTHGLGPFLGEVEFDGIFASKAVNPGLIIEDVFGDALIFPAPFLLIIFFRI